MRHRFITFLLCGLYVFFIGCQSSKQGTYLADDTNSYRDKRVNSVTLKNGETRIYDKVGGRYYEEKRDSVFERKIVGYDPAGAALNFDINKILEVQTASIETDAGGTILTVLLAAGGGILLLGLLIIASYSGHYGHY